jgi:hypothetical protein
MFRILFAVALLCQNRCNLSRRSVVFHTLGRGTNNLGSAGCPAGAVQCLIVSDR